MSPTRRITDADAARALFVGLATEPGEVAEAVYLDPKWTVCGSTRFAGGRGHVVVSIRRLVAEALAADAATVILAHNHPSGDPEPSEADLSFSRRLVATLAALEMPLVDHLVVGRDHIVSMRERGLM